MEMFLMGLCLSLLGVAVSAAAFAAATRDEPRHRESEAGQKLPLPAAQFFLDDAGRPAAPPRVPIEVLLLQLEHHVRLEQAAAESFLDLPTRESLHTPSSSPLVH